MVMAFTSNFDRIDFGTTCALYAHLDAQGSPEWRFLGSITRTIAGTHLALRPEADIFRPLWSACGLDAQEDSPGRVTFGVASTTGRVDVIATASITPAVLRAMHSLALSKTQASVRPLRTSGIAPRTLRTNFPAWMMSAGDAEESARVTRAEARDARRAARAARIAALLNQAA
jgi:hypothetical protein